MSYFHEPIDQTCVMTGNARDAFFALHAFKTRLHASSSLTAVFARIAAQLLTCLPGERHRLPTEKNVSSFR